MIDSTFHVELNGVKYRLAEDAEGRHYTLSGEPLRPPNASIVQGEGRQVFQMRPDTLLWTLTDWSGGEGQIRFDANAPNRWRYLHAVRPFDRPGQLLPGYFKEDTLNAADATMSVPLRLVRLGASLYGFDPDNTNVYLWGGTKWGAATALIGPTTGPRGLSGDSTAVYWVESGEDELWKWTGSGNPTLINHGTINTTAEITVPLGPHVYVYSRTAAKVWEIPKSGAAGIELDSWTEIGLETRSPVHVAALGGRVYVMIPLPNETVIREIVPSSAAGVGFGYELGRLGGLHGEMFWAHGNLLFIRGLVDGQRAALMYYQPESQTYGTLGEYRPDAAEDLTTELAGGLQAASALSSFYAHDGPFESLVQVDALSGGTAVVGVGGNFGESIVMGADLVFHKGDIFLNDGNAHVTHFTERFRYAKYGAGGVGVAYATSPWHDFDLVEEKVLTGLSLSCKALPTGGTIRVYTAVDGTDSWTLRMTYNTVGGKGAFVPVSNGSTTVDFHTLSVKIEIDSHADNPTIVLGVDVLASVVRPQRVWTLLLDIADDAYSRGADKITTIETAGQAESVIVFKDGYQSREAGVFETVNVVVDEYHVSLDRANEGAAQVRLREIA